MDKNIPLPPKSNRTQCLLQNYYSMNWLWLATHKDKMESAMCFSKKELNIFLVLWYL